MAAEMHYWRWVIALTILKIQTFIHTLLKFKARKICLIFYFSILNDTSHYFSLWCLRWFFLPKILDIHLVVMIQELDTFNTTWTCTKMLDPGPVLSVTNTCPFPLVSLHLQIPMRASGSFLHFYINNFLGIDSSSCSSRYFQSNQITSLSALEKKSKGLSSGECFFLAFCISVFWICLEVCMTENQGFLLVDSPALDIFKIYLDRVLDHLD